MDITEKILLRMEFVKTRPKMFIESPLSYNAYSNFISGYLMGLEMAYEKKIFNAIGDYFAKKNRVSTSVAWTYNIRILNKNLAEEDHINILFQTLEGYFKANPKWYE